MKKNRENNIKKIIAVILTLIIVLCSIPFEQWTLRKVYAENEMNESSIIELTDNNNEIVSWATVVLSYEKGDSAVTEEKTLLYDREKKGYKLTDDDYAALKDETLSNIKVNIEAEGFEKIIDDTSLITAVSNEKKSVILTSNFSVPIFQIELVGNDLQYIYTGNSIQLIKPITGLSKENLTQSTGELDTLSYITTIYEYNIEYSLDNKTYQKDIPTGVYAGIYDVYVKVSEKASKYTHTDAEFNQETASFESDETKYIIKHKEITIQKAQLTDGQFQFDLTGTTGAGTQSNPILVEWNKKEVTYQANKTVSDGSVSYRVEVSSNHCFIDEKRGSLSFDENCIGNTYQVYASITDMQNYDDKEICYYIKIVKQNLDTIQFKNIVQEDGNYKKTITYGESWNIDDSKLVYGDSKEEIPNVTYSITSQGPLNGDAPLESGETIADINETTGNLSVNRSGIVVVTAKIDDSLYQGDNGNTYEYTLTIEKKRHDIHFANILSPVKAQYGDKLTYKAEFIGKDSEDNRNINTIEYKILDNNTVKDTNSVIDANTGEVTVNSVRADSEQTFIVVTATLEANDKYAKTTATYTIESHAAEQKFEFDSTPVNIDFGQNPPERTAKIKENGSESGNSVVYKLKETDLTVEPIKNGYISINEDNGHVSLHYEKITEITPDFEVQVIASLSGCPAGSSKPLYKACEGSYILNYHKAANDTNSHYDIKGTDNKLQAEELWYRSDVTLTANSGYQLATSLDGNTFDEIFKNKLTFSNSISETQIYYRNTETKSISIGPKISLKIDKTMPEEKNLEINYIGNEIFDKLSQFDYIFGVSAKHPNIGNNQEYIKVTLSASDSETNDSKDSKSGIYKFKYWGESLESINSGQTVFTSEVIKPNEILESNSLWKVEGDKVSYTFTVPKEFKGKINFTAYDKAGNEVTYNQEDKTIIVADDTAPAVKLSFNQYKPENPNSDGKMVLQIEDASFDNTNEDIALFYHENITIAALYTPFHGKKEDISEDVLNNINWNEENKNEAACEFTKDGEYKITVTSTDPAGNKGESTISFQIDITAPELSATFFAVNETEEEINIPDKDIATYTANSIKAKICVIEDNFFTDDLQYTVNYTPFSNGKLDEANKKNITKETPINWEGQTAVCEFTKEGKFEVTFGYKDKSGNQAETITKVFYIDRTKFGTESNLEGTYNTYNNMNYYQTDVIYQISVKENLFDKNALTIKAYYTPHNGEQQDISETVKNGMQQWDWDTKNQQNVGKYVFEDEGYYKIVHSYTSKTGTGADVEVSKEFYIDKTKPKVLFEYLDNESADSDYTTYYKQKKEAQITINGEDFNEFNPFNPQKVSLVIQEKNDLEQEYTNVTNIYAKKYNELAGWEKDGNDFIKKIEFNNNADYKVSLSFTDNAGQESNKEEREFTVDLTDPQVNVTFSNTDVRNENQFRSSRTATITIIEHNFEPSRVNALITAVNIKGEKVCDKNDIIIEEQFKAYLKQADSWKKDDKDDNKYTACIVFEENANYTFDIQVLDMAGRSNIDLLGESIVSYEGIACEEFTVDTISPTGSIKIADWTQSKDGTVWNKFLTNITFALWLQTDAQIIIDSNDNLSGVEYVRYYIADQPLEEETVKGLSDDAWITSSEFTMKPNTRFVVYAQIMDKAGNAITISSDGVILDDIRPEGKDSTEPSIIIRTENQNNIYNQKVELDIFVKDPAGGVNNDVYSGIKKVTYQVKNNASNTITQEDTLYEFKKDNPTKEELVNEWSTDKSLVIETNVNNSNDIVVSVTAVDNAGNSRTKELPLAIDVTAPRIEIHYDNNDGISYNNSDEYRGKTYFKEERTATIDIIERNFDKDKVNINVTSTDGVLPDISDWTVINGTASNGDDTIHRATIHYYADGDYTFDISYTDMAGNPANPDTDIEYNGLAPQQFTIDTKNPIVSVSYGEKEEAPLNGNWFKQARTATVTVIEHNFDAAKVDVKVIAKDMAGNDVNVQKNHEGYKDYVDYITNTSNWRHDGNIHTIVLNYTEDAHYTFDISMTDLAGRKNVNEKNELYVDYQGSNAPTAFIVDKSVPVVMATYTSSAAAVNENHYNQDMNLQFTVSENNFYQEDIKIEVVYTSYNGTVNENYGENVTKALEWENPTSLDSWTAKATYIFTDEGKYVVTIFYTDKAGNISNIEQKEFYIDKTLPQIKFEYLDEGSADSVNTTYYKQARTAKITITENDFNPKNIRFHILRTLNSEQIYTDVTGIYAVKYDELDGWEKNKNDFTKIIEFDEDADYEVSLSFTDDAGNQADIEKQTFTVDLTDPRVNVTFSNTDVRNENQFRSSRTATITIIEHNFEPDRVNALITAVDANGEPVRNENESAVQDEFKSYLMRADSWDNAGDIHTAHILFEKDANYTFDIKTSDMAGRSNVDSQGKNMVSYTGVACEKFTVDTISPTGSIKIADWTQSKDGTVWNKFLTNITFALWLQNDATVVINNDDSLSGVEYVRYYTVEHPLTEETVKALPDSVWTESSSFRIKSDARFVVYARIMDNAGNEIIISSDGVILDNTKPAGDGTQPRITIRTEDKNNIYNQDVRLDIYVEDPSVGSSSVYSGIQEVTCTVTNMAADVVTQNVILYEFGNNNPKQEELVREWSSSESFVVDQSTNNSNDIIVAVTATDNAGNVSTQYLPLAIDVTAPRIEIRYDNDDGDSSFEETTYFKAERTATVDIIERNFNAEDVNINVTSTDGTLPDISDWTVVGGTASNSDDTIHRATLHYYADGDYTFDISYTDMAGNVADDIEYSGLAPQQFTIDSILPVISVVYDNNDAVNGNYYNQVRTATVTIEEHNFETSRIIPEITAEGGTANVPQLSDWSKTGDTHTATISYTGDTLYGFSLQYTDMAGNQATAYERDSFYVDMTMPELSIQRIENESANKEELIAPVVTFSDQYYDRIEITLNGENADGLGFYDINENGGTFTFNNITKDDIYTLSASVFDKAGNPTQEQIVFSVNRNGSTYDLEASTEKINGSYIKETKDIVVYEINPDPLLTHKVTLYKNGKTVLLTEGIDYSVNVDGGGGSWYKYIYNIFAKNFEDDGVYRLSVQSTDKAGNIAENTIDTKNKEISFGVDNTLPNIMLLNLESGKTYAMNSLNVLMSISDNLKLSSVFAYVDDVLVREWSSNEIISLINANEDFAFNIDGTSTNAHDVRIVAIDAAGNSQEIEARDFYVTTNMWIRFYTNTFLFWGSIGAILFFVVGIIGIIIIKKHRKKK